MEQLAADALERGRQIAAQELVTILAHDLRNYLTPLKMRIDLTRRKAVAEGREHDVRDLSSASATIERMGRMVAELLDAARLEEGVFSISPAPVNLTEVVHDIAESLQIHETPITVDAPGDIVTQADPDRMRQAVENLLSNAIRYAPEGTGVRVVVTSEVRNGRDWVSIAIIDKGPGIAPEILPRLFQRFSSGPDSTGLGLGLYVASRIAQAHGGTLTADSNPGQGTRFTLSIPQSRDTTDTARP
jgi:two-component system, OmpR family, sensor kinase